MFKFLEFGGKDMKLRLSVEEFDKGLEELSKKIFDTSPRTFEKRGTYSDTDVVRYAKVSSFSEMNWEDKSHFPAKEALLPVNEVLFILQKMNTKWLLKIQEKD